ncbi:multicopper oxidase family protein [Komarekiella sp. 'clone 1']|uniref:Multicopper oxidase family protein n=1 Tax=Komarekiella delphini-convector SJRDD-AB1 TaxID=2593771 RepID=A0AA40T1F7_9NOST|nr:multicopper oxidase family protein [Komarekiella delphini-convector]MBD6618850.1 multicopper oxidase family protein [Komarekiella delphini-convector SJRDD-AB1]
MKRISRREALKLAAFAGGCVLLPVVLQHRGYAQRTDERVEPFTLFFRKPPVLSPVRSDATTDYYRLTMQRATVEILPGLNTEIWGYNGIFPGPTIKQRRNRQSIVRYINNIGKPMSVHLHGMASQPQYDGYAEDLIPHRYYKDYIYPNNTAATLWYHDHALGKTSLNVYMGMAGMYIVQDENELSLPLPKDNYDIPLIIHDKKFASDGSQVFDDQAQHGLMGDVITVNGVPWPRMEVANRKYRFRILNASVSRSYKLALSTGDNLTVIGTDAGLLSAPVSTKDMRIGMAERYELLIDFSKYSLGTQIVLQNLGPANNDNFGNTDKIMRFDVVRQESDDSSIPSTLRNIQFLPESSAVRSRDFTFQQNNRLWVINGNGWNRNRVDANPQLEEVEIWRLHNNSGLWFHPVHLHLIDAQILDRNGQPPLPYERGLKDVFYVGENETVRVIGKFRPNIGKYMYHCHNMVHEDHDMMSQFKVGSGGIDPLSAPAKPLPAPPL